jgi:hypothetical protein
VVLQEGGTDEGHMKLSANPQIEEMEQRKPVQVWLAGVLLKGVV